MPNDDYYRCSECKSHLFVKHAVFCLSKASVLSDEPNSVEVIEERIQYKCSNCGHFAAEKEFSS